MQKRGLVKIGGKSSLNKRGLSEVVTTLLFVLLALGAVLLVWFVVRNLISGASENIGLEEFSANLEIPGQNILLNEFAKSVSFIVKRGAGEGIINAVQVVLEDSSGQSSSAKYVFDGGLNPLDSKIVYASYASIGDVKKISIAPIITTADGAERMGSVAASASVSEDVEHVKVLKFDGASESAYTDSSNGFPSSTITVSAWVNVAQVGAWHNLVWHDWGNPAGGWILVTDTNGAGFDIQPAAGSSTAYATIAPNQWVHLTAVYDGAKKTIYKDGVYVTNVADSGGLAASGRTHVGSVGGTLTNFNRKLSDVRIYSKALTAEQIKNLPYDVSGSISDGLVARWKLDWDYKDSSSKGNDLIEYPDGAAEWVDAV